MISYLKFNLLNNSGKKYYILFFIKFILFFEFNFRIYTIKSNKDQYTDSQMVFNCKIRIQKNYKK